ncbi:MAG: HTH-type transcriptional repressor YvoA [Verrucomicrobiota bacterium]|jgi:GntR family transcriptional regulator
MRDPVYQQLHELLRGLVRDGEYKSGGKFPTEREVGERYGVSRVTANKALSSLVSEGVLEFRKGIGTFVRDLGMDYDLRTLMSFTRKAEISGKVPETEVLKFVSTHAAAVDASVREALQIGADEKLHYVERLRLADGVPLILERRIIVARHCPGLTAKMLAGSLYTLFTQHYGLTLTGAEQTLRAANLSEEDASTMGVSSGDAVLWVRATGQCQHGPLWMEDTLYRGDLYEFHNSIGNGRTQKPARATLIQTPSPQLFHVPDFL